MSGEGETKLERAISPVCDAAGVELIDVEIRSGTVLVSVDRAGGLDLDAVAEVSRAISAVLDEDERLGPDGRYDLEVSSPGLERRLRRFEHFKAAIGVNVAIRTTAGTPGERRVSGTIAAADPDGVDVALDNSTEGSTRRLCYNEIERARTVVDWQAALREGKERTKREKVATS